MPNIHRKKPSRSIGIAERANYRDNKVDLRTDFNSRCGYCDDDDRFMGGRRGYQIDHFAPKKKFSGLEREYTNLVYCCPFCNRSKSDHWPSDSENENIVNNEGFVDPCDIQYDQHICRNNKGRIVARSILGKYIHEKLKLHLLRHELIWKHGKIKQLIVELKGISAPDALIVQFYTAADEIMDSIIEAQ